VAAPDIIKKLNQVLHWGFFCLMFIIPLSAYAQKKIGHVDSQELLDAMPEMQGAVAKIDSLGKAYNKDLKQIENRFETAYNESNKDEAERVQLRLYILKDNDDSIIEARSEDLFQPIRAKLSNAIKEVAIEKGIELVLDSRYDAIVLYARPGSDITADVKKKLGIQTTGR